MHFRKSPRMPEFDYIGWFAYSLTLVTRLRTRVFTERCNVDLVADALGRSLDSYGFTLHAYCFMPDHLHLLVSGTDSRPLTRFVQHFKQLSGYAYKKATGAHLWQISYWDRALRSDEDLLTAARYIWGNPVRAGLVEDAKDYPFLRAAAAARGAVGRAEALQLLRRSRFARSDYVTGPNVGASVLRRRGAPYGRRPARQSHDRDRTESDMASSTQEGARRA